MTWKLGVIRRFRAATVRFDVAARLAVTLGATLFFSLLAHEATHVVLALYHGQTDIHVVLNPFHSATHCNAADDACIRYNVVVPLPRNDEPYAEAAGKLAGAEILWGFTYWFHPRRSA